MATFPDLPTRIWLEPLRHDDGRPRYSSRGQLYRTKAGGADGPVLCEQTITPTLESCRALLARGITGRFETWHEGDSFARLTGDIEKAAKLDVKEGPVRFVRYEPAPTAEKVPQTRPDSAPMSDDYAAVGGEVAGEPSPASKADLAASRAMYVKDDHPRADANLGAPLQRHAVERSAIAGNPEVIVQAEFFSV